MNLQGPGLDDLIHTFANEWLRLTDPQTGERLVADPILVLGADGTTAVPRAAFLAAVTARSTAVSAVPSAQTELTAAHAIALGDRMVVATLSWTFSHDTSTTLVGDFLLQREEGDRLRCVAYLPRTNVMEHLPPSATTD